MTELNYRVRTLIFPESAERLSDSNYASMGRLIRATFIQGLERDNRFSDVKERGFAVEVHLTDITEEEQRMNKAKTK